MKYPSVRIGLRGLLLALNLVVASSGFATTYYVSTTGSNSNPGTSGQPFATWQKGVDMAVAGDTVEIAAGTYRDQTVSFAHSGTSSNPIRVKAASGATVTLKGSKVVTGWTVDSGSVYRVSGWTSYFGTWQSSPDDARDKARNQLFVNGAYVQEVASRAAVVAGTFYIDNAADRIYLRLSDSSNPSSKSVEVTSTAGPLLTTNGQSYIYLESLNFAHCANGPQDTAAVRVTDGNHCQVTSCSVQYAAGAGITIKGEFHTVTNSVFNYNGQLGIHATRADDCLVLNSETSYNNTLPGKQFDPGWEGGGNKFSRTNRFVVDGLLAHDNFGSGIWFDVANRDATITNCRSYLNRAGIHYEISYTGLILNNLCYNNRIQGADINSPVGQGIYISSSAGCRVLNNTCWGNDTRGIEVGGSLRDDGEDATVYSYATVVKNNICGLNQVGNSNAKDYAIGTSSTANPGLTNTVVPFAQNISDYNLFYRTDGHNFFSAGGSSYTSLAAYTTATGFDPNSLWGDPVFKNVSTSDFHLTYTSPAIDQGIALGEVFDDFDGVTRPQGVTHDIGAFEKAALFFQTEALAVPSKSSDTHRTFTNVALSGGAASILDSNAVGDFVIYTVPQVPPGSYNVRIGIKKQDTRGIWQLRVGKWDTFATSASDVGTPQDEYASSSQYLEFNVGTWAPGTATSDKWFKFTVTGKNSSSSDYTMAFDYILLVPTN